MSWIARFTKGAAAACAAVALLAAPAATHAAEPPYEIEVLFPLTGFGAFFGVPQVQALKAIETLVNRTGGIKGRPVHFVVHDDQTDPKVDVQLASAVFAKHPAVMLGPDTTGQCNAVIPLAKNGPVVYCFTPQARPPAGGYVFATGPLNDYAIHVVFKYLSERGLKRIATLTSNDATGQDADKHMAEAAEKDHSIELVDREYYNPRDVSVTAQISRIKARKPQALVVWTTGTPFGTALRSIKEEGLDIPIVGGSGNALYGQLEEYKGIIPRELLFPNNLYLAPEVVTDKGVKDAIAAMYRELGALGAKPDQGHNSDWDGVMLVVEALRKLRTGATARQVREYIANVRNWPGVDGRYDFHAEPQRGIGANGVIVVRWDPAHAKFVGVSKPGGDPLTR